MALIEKPKTMNNEEHLRQHWRERDLRVFDTPYRGLFGTIMILLTARGQDGDEWAATDLVWTPIDNGTCGRIEPAVQIDPGMAQKLMEGLWACGIRPRAGQGSVGQLAATENHLDDMRALVSKQYKAELPERKKP